MAFHPVTQEIAEAFGYEPMSEAERNQQFQLTPNYDSIQDGVPKAGSIYLNKCGVYRYYWIPEGDNYTDEEKGDLQGWYDIPLNEDIEDWCFDSCAFTPAEDEVEPDHPDSWLRLLGLI